MNQQLASRIQSAVDDQASAATPPTIRAVQARAGHLRNRRRAVAGAAALPVLAGVSIAVVKQLGHESPTVSVKPESTRTDTNEPGWMLRTDDVAGHGIISTDLPADLQPVTVRPWGPTEDVPSLMDSPDFHFYGTHIRLADGRTVVLTSTPSSGIKPGLLDKSDGPWPASVNYVFKDWSVELRAVDLADHFTADELLNLVTTSTTFSAPSGRPTLQIAGSTVLYDGLLREMPHQHLSSFTWQAGVGANRRALSIVAMDGDASRYQGMINALGRPEPTVVDTPIGRASADPKDTPQQQAVVIMKPDAPNQRLVKIYAEGLASDEFRDVLRGLGVSSSPDIQRLVEGADRHPQNHAIPVYSVDRSAGTINATAVTATGIGRYIGACASPTGEAQRWIIGPTAGLIDGLDCAQRAANFAIALPGVQLSDGSTRPGMLLAVSVPGSANFPVEVGSADEVDTRGAMVSTRFASWYDGFDLFVLIGDIGQPDEEISMLGEPLRIVNSPAVPTDLEKTTPAPSTSTAATPTTASATTATVPASSATSTSSATTAASTTVGPSTTATAAPATTATTAQATTGAPTTEAAVTPSSIVVSTTAPTSTATTG